MTPKKTIPLRESLDSFPHSLQSTSKLCYMFIHVHKLTKPNLLNIEAQSNTKGNALTFEGMYIH